MVASVEQRGAVQVITNEVLGASVKGAFSWGLLRTLPLGYIRRHMKPEDFGLTPADVTLEPGDRVRLLVPGIGVTLSKDTGTVLRRDDPDWDEYWISLDEPALYDHGVGDEPERLTEVCVMVEELERLSS